MRECHGQEAVKLVDEVDAVAQVFEIDDARTLGQRLEIIGEIGSLDEFARSDDGSDLSGAAGRQHVEDAGREIEHRRYAAEGVKAEERHESAAGIRQQQAQLLFERGQSLYLVAEDEAACYQAVMGEWNAVE